LLIFQGAEHVAQLYIHQINNQPHQTDTN
jgi:hypothetical protein